MVGTLVWDRVEPTDPAAGPSEEWGGIAYALSAATRALPDGWTVRALVRVGTDLEREARALLDVYPRLDASSVVAVPEPSNRVVLRYRTEADRTERLTGGVSGWSAAALAERATGCDALLVNFISGSELTLEGAQELRARFSGPIYADFHSLFLGTAADGTRVSRELDAWRRWCACFDYVQMNEDEFGLLDPHRPFGQRIEAVLTEGARLLAVTRGAGGATIAFRDETDGERLVVEDVTIPAPRRGDPTGCGDVWGATMFSRLLAGADPTRAAETANRLAALNVEHRGARPLIEAFATEELP